MLTNIFDYYKQPCRPKDRANAIFVPLVGWNLTVLSTQIRLHCACRRGKNPYLHSYQRGDM